MKDIDQFTGKYAFLSNFFHHDGRITAEHLFQLQKNSDIDYQCVVLDAPTPGEAKRLGSVQGMAKLSRILERDIELRPDWLEIKEDVMWRVLQIKFREGSDCRKWLLETGDALLVEGNWHGDAYWGFDFKSQAGLNVLGQLLMELRTAIRESEEGG